MFRIVARTFDYTAAMVPGGVFHIWHHKTTLEGVRHLEQAIVKASAEVRNEKIPILLVVEPNAPPPSAELRKAIAEVMKSTAPVVLMTALVYEGDGFGAAVVRGVVTGLSLLARHPFPYKVFSGSQAAFAWMRAQAERPATVNELERAFAMERSRFARAS